MKPLYKLKHPNTIQVMQNGFLLYSVKLTGENCLHLSRVHNLGRLKPTEPNHHNLTLTQAIQVLKPSFKGLHIAR
jgi:hypothetical protein